MRELQNQGDRVGGYIGSMISAVDYLQAMRVRKIARLAIDQVLTGYDALIGPSSESGGRRVVETFNRPVRPAADKKPGLPHDAALVPAGNLAGVPGLTIPNGFDKNNVPTGLQLLGAAWNEETLIAIADAYQQETDWHRRRPPITGKS
jgi:aspartyl-tRNA(Asn)/glutamyl-tRNA(Gln) amidotransferase subunit A